jgi:hypothetical protein
MPYQTIRDAITERVSLTAHYDHYVRFFSPHVLGLNRSGRKAALVYQYGGGKPGGLRYSGEWLCLEIDGITAMRRNGDIWHAGDAPPRPPCIHRVELAAEIAPRAGLPSFIPLRSRRRL